MAGSRHYSAEQQQLNDEEIRDEREPRELKSKIARDRKKFPGYQQPPIAHHAGEMSDCSRGAQNGADGCPRAALAEGDLAGAI